VVNIGAVYGFMVTEKIKQLQALQAKAKELQDTIESERTQELSSLPERYGYESLAGFIKAVKAAAGSKRGRGRKAGKARAAKPAAKSGSKKRTRAKITAETKAQVKSSVEAGKTGAQIAKELGISLPSVQNIKKELGLVKARAGSS
jgi:DNA invertase Pin-like site-specific DNA recombinase